MLPLLLGAAAIALFATSCSRNEDRPREETPPPPRVTPPPLPPVESSFRPFGPEQCNPDAVRPERFTIQDARQEYCRLSEVLFGRRCSISGNQVIVERESRLPSILTFAHGGHDGVSMAARNTEIRERLAQLEGLQTYLYSGQKCRLDGDGDLIDLIEAHSLYEAYFRSEDPAMSQAFREGRVGCIVRRGLLTEDHHHGEAAGQEHGSGGPGHGHTHDLILTPATLRLNTFPVGTRASDCLIVR